MARSKLTAIASQCLLLAYPLLNGCALVLEYPITSASLGVWGTTGKGPTDHAVSYALNEDCEILRAINSKPICKKASDFTPDVIDKSFNLETPRNIQNARLENSTVTPLRIEPNSLQAKPNKKLAKSKLNKNRKN